MKQLIRVNGRPIVLLSNDLEDELDVDEITSINYSNLFGEAITISALYNKIGLMRAEVEREVKLKKLDLKVYEAQTRKTIRRKAAINNGKAEVDGTEIKLTNDVVDELVYDNLGFREKSKEVIELEKDFAMVDTLFWALQSKSKKLEQMLRPVTPKEFESELIEGSINTFMIKKPEIY